MNGNKQIEKQLEAYRQEMPEAEEEWPRKIQRAYSCMITYLFDTRLTVSWMKTKCYINGHNFAVKFNHCVEMSPKEYINHHRIEAAKVLLRDARLNDIAVSLIATEVGFRSISAFSKSFKRHSGITPSKWRQEHNSGTS